MQIPKIGMGDPNLSAGLPYRPCVGVMLARSDGAVFAGERMSPNAAWQMPQGGIEDGETPRDAALRELREETGVAPKLVRIEAETERWFSYDLPPEIVPKLWNGQFRGQTQKWFLMRFLGTDADVNIAQPEREFRRWCWMSQDALMKAIVPFKRALYAEVFTALTNKGL